MVTQKIYRRCDLRALGLPTRVETLRGLVEREGFPRQFTLFGRTVAWDAQAVDAWIETRKCQSA